MIIIRSRHPSHKPLRKARIKSNWKRIVYRLGSTTKGGKFDGQINSIDSIVNSSSKFKMKKLFKEHGVKSTNFYIDPKQITEKTKFPLIAKINFGSRGKGMVKLDNYAAFKSFMKSKYHSNYYFEEYFNGCREYRVHFCRKAGIGAFYACRKMRKNDAKDRWFFNSENCVWINEFEAIKDGKGKFVNFSTKKQAAFDKPNTWNDIIKNVELALKAVGLDIGAVDIRVKKEGNFVILETNSAPGLAECGTKAYIDTLTRIGKTF